MKFDGGQLGAFFSPFQRMKLYWVSLVVPSSLHSSRNPLKSFGSGAHLSTITQVQLHPVNIKIINKNHKSALKIHMKILCLYPKPNYPLRSPPQTKFLGPPPLWILKSEIENIRVVYICEWGHLCLLSHGSNHQMPRIIGYRNE